MTLGDALGHLNILKDIQILKFEYPQQFLDIQNSDIQLCDIGTWLKTEFEYPKLFLDIWNFQYIQLCDIGTWPMTLEYL